jgi:hypothetical protein
VPTAACKKRASSDVSAVADPNTGVAVYNKRAGGWIVDGEVCTPRGRCSVDDGGGGRGTCDHSECTTGDPLNASCDDCTAQICPADPFCCNTAWDATCVAEVTIFCPQSC